jgi:WhiB family transcriptional regulator, redox-sensing transcriptional regulator
MRNPAVARRTLTIVGALDGVLRSGVVGVDDASPTLASELMELLRRPAWMAQAVCREHPEVDFHDTRRGNLAAAKAVCARCPVRVECLEFALELDSGTVPQGIYGGMSGPSRARLRRQRDDAARRHHDAA